MTKKQTIAIDIDDVTADSTESIRLLVNKRWGVNLTKEHYRVPGEYQPYYERVWEQHGLADKIDFTKLEDEMIDDQSHVLIMKDAKSSINELSKKFRVVFITARSPSWEAATRKWFEAMFADQDIELYFSEGMGDAGVQTKGQVCKKLGVDWLIDDNPSHCMSAMAEDIKTILFGEYGWHPREFEEAVRCKDWAEVLEYFTHEA